MKQQLHNSFFPQLIMDDSFKFSDEELISRFQQGDEYAYKELVIRYRNKLMTFIYRFLNNYELTEDIVQDTFLKLYTHKHYYRSIAKFSTWIYTIAGNLAKTELRKKKRRKVTNFSQLGAEDRDIEIPAVQADVDNELQNKYAENKIQEAIQKLPVHFRTVIILRDIQELSYEEVSSIVDVPLGTVKSRINRARLQLQKDLKELA